MPTGIMSGRVPFGCRAPPSVVFSCQSFCSSQKLAVFQCCAAFSYALEKFYARQYLKCYIANLENRPVAPTARQVGTLPPLGDWNDDARKVRREARHRGHRMRQHINDLSAQRGA